jgi:hypothetical protein
VATKRSDVSGTESEDDKRRSKRNESGHDAASPSSGGVTHSGNGGNNWTGSDLTNGDGSQKSLTGHPVMSPDGARTHHWHYDESTAEAQ